MTRDALTKQRDQYADELRQAGARVLQLQGAVAACNALLEQMPDESPPAEASATNGTGEVADGGGVSP